MLLGLRALPGPTRAEGPGQATPFPKGTCYSPAGRILVLPANLAHPRRSRLPRALDLPVRGLELSLDLAKILASCQILPRILLGSLQVLDRQLHIALAHERPTLIVDLRLDMDDLEGAPPVRPDPPIRHQHHGAASLPRLVVPQDIHAHFVFVPRLPGEPGQEFGVPAT